MEQLQAYMDHALPVEEQASLARHLADCASCQGKLAALRRQNEELAQRLSILDPRPEHTPDAGQALARFRARLQPPLPAGRVLSKGRMGERVQSPRLARWRPAIAALAALAVVATLFSFASVRRAAAELLGVFRVRKFAVIPVDPSQMERLEELEELLNAGVLGEPTFLREPDEPQTVVDVVEAAERAGFPVRSPTFLPSGAVLQDITLEFGPAMHFEVERAQVQALLEFLDAGDVTLPSVDPLSADVDFPTMVHQQYRIGQGDLWVFQMPSPEVTLPPGIEPNMLGEALLQFLGMPAEDAQKLAKSIDWASTLVIPLPANVAQFREVEVDGVPGLLLEGTFDGHSWQHNIVLWQREGIVYVVKGLKVSPEQLLQVADSLE
jgi:hypothetical protein